MKGTQLPELTPRTLTPSTLQLFLFSSVTRNPHRIHYDLPYAQSEGYSNLLVHGPLQWAVVATTIAEWFWGHGILKKLSLRSVAPAYVGEPLTVRGAVTEAMGPVCRLEVWIEKEGGEKTTLGNAEVELRGEAKP
jgi:hydroxyacyl-ACP dehydratase HTD2-like protein with hotdog domain